ncbi:MAG: MBOAT family protein [Pseudomonadota bacterium]|nr:MBOAT family protein [Pseudomonadota bacterium]
MLFNSVTFVILFLPLCLAAYYMTAALGGPRAAGWCLVLFSTIFYGWLNPQFVVLLYGSVLFNYTLGALILKRVDQEAQQKWLLLTGIALNVGLLFYFKYFFSLLHWLDGLGFPVTAGVQSVVLPIGISFFTFTQIGYLVDCQAGMVKERNFLNYLLFVLFFPHLIAGPIVHHKEMIPQFAKPETYRLKVDNIAIGLVLFSMGLFKKAVIADHFAPIAKVAFESSDLTSFAAWGGVLAYSLQLYFDFSGYSEMAIGLARMFGILFPANFNSPYKAVSIIDYWQRWHMTLTRYLTLYIYNPIALRIARRRMAAGLAVSKEATRSPGGFASMIMLPTLVTITLAGIWHGAGLQFLVFGLLHGLYLCANHAARAWWPKRHLVAPYARQLITLGKVALTYSCVLVAQVFFRASSIDNALDVLHSMAGLTPYVPSPNPHPTYDFIESILRDTGHDIGPWLLQLRFDAPLTLALGYCIVWGLPNALEVMAKARPSLTPIETHASLLQWRPTISWGLGMGLMAATAMLAIAGTKEFLYFQF